MATDLPDFYTNGTYVIERRPYQSAATYLVSVMGFESEEAYSYCKRMRGKLGTANPVMTGMMKSTIMFSE